MEKNWGDTPGATLNGPVLCVYISVAFVTSFFRELGHKRKIW